MTVKIAEPPKTRELPARRDCLKCGRTFIPVGRFNFICRKCDRDNDQIASNRMLSGRYRNLTPY